MLARLIAWMAAMALVAAPAAAGDKVRYEKTEVEKARGKCVGSVLGGALLGALVGRAVDRNGAAAGALIGAGAGAAACAVIMNNAKHKDRIVAAQIRSALHVDAPYVTAFPSDDPAATTTFQGLGGAAQTLDAARLRPVRYQNEDGAAIASPVLQGTQQDCRAVSSSLTTAGNTAALPTQYVCRTPEGNYEPYGLAKA